MARALIAGIGALGALGAVVTGVIVTRPDKAPEPGASIVRASAETVCITSNVRLVEGMTRNCLTAAQFDALRDRAVIGGDGAPVEASLTGHGDETAAIRTCAEYDAATRAGWYALTSADMRREEYFRRSCGALEFLAKAEPAETSHFAGGEAEPGDIRSMAAEEALAFGERETSASVDIAEIEDGVWKIAIGAGVTMVYEIAHADFTGDGQGEILAYVSVGAAGGTARG
jgi:hypothetical protein